MTSTSNLDQCRLTPQELEHYHREGYVIPTGPILPDGKFLRLKQHFEDRLAALPAGDRPEGMNVPHWVDPALFEWIFADEILDLVEPITGPDIVLYATHFICKPQGDGKRVPWHEDAAYWRSKFDITGPIKIVTVWLAIDPSRIENGCMQVIPRTHIEGKKGFSDYSQVDDVTRNTFPNEIVKEQRDPKKAIPIVLEPNHASLHDARIIHGSEPNTSTLRRCGFTMRFMSAKIRLTEAARAIDQLYLARGKGHPDQEYADPTKVYPELYEQRMEAGRRMGRKEH